MAPSAGTRLGPYEILSALGAGGMGEVYRARDSKLNRDVAIKVLLPAVASDPDRLARFSREAQVLASLNHPNIAHLYGLERQEGRAGQEAQGATTFLVMELVDGEELAQRIARGPIALDEALPIAKQIAEALDAAHEQGIVHRDLKPANIKVREDGTVKVLDFGLAKAMDPAGAGVAPGFSPANPSLSPTVITPAMMTGVGVILGTAAYMSPEQAKGRTVDKRSDVWAFGCVLFEMLTATRAFAGEDVSDTLAAVLRGEPDWDALPGDLPPTIVLLMRRCLEKDRRRRIGDISTVLFLLDQPLAAATPTTTSASVVSPPPLWKRAIPVVAGALLASAAIGAAMWALKSPPPPQSVTRFTVTLGEGQQFTGQNAQQISLSPDGVRLLYVANNQMYLRSMSDLEARPIPGTQVADGLPNSPEFSPDGRSIVFFSDRTLKRIVVTGGAAVTLCQADAPMGISWDSSGIVFGQGSKGIMRVSANGGIPEVLVSVKQGELAHGPQILPGGEFVLFTLGSAATPDGWDKAQIVVQSLKSGERKTLVSGGSDGRYLPTGHIVYALAGVLYAVPFDGQRLAVTSGPVPVVEGVYRTNLGLNGASQFSASLAGSLVYMPGPVARSRSLDLALIDRNGTIQPLKLTPGPYEHPRLSPDGNRVAFGSDDGKEATVWIYDLAGAASMRRLTQGGRNRFPVWSADGERVAFQSDREGDLGIFWQRADGTVPAERLTKPEQGTAHIPESWSRDGRTLLISVAKGSSQSVATVTLDSRKVTPFGGIESSIPASPIFSPDGRWVAYTVAGPRFALFVQPFPATGASYQLANHIGVHPIWSADGKELFFSGPTGAAVVSVATQQAFTFGNPSPVPRLRISRGPTFERDADLARDGKRFIGVIDPTQNIGASAAPQIQIILNWFEELKARVPTR